MLAMEEGSPAGTTSTRSPDDELLFEFMLNALRLNDGFGEALFVRAHRAVRPGA